MNKFAVFILTHNRPDRVITYKTLQKCGYTGSVYLVVDDEDQSVDRYIENFGKDRVIVFSKNEIAKRFDQGDNFDDRRTITYARNAAFEIAASLGLDYFLQLDDDYDAFDYRFDSKFEYVNRHTIKNLDTVFSALLEFYSSSEKVDAFAMFQSGDFMGGSESREANGIYLKRKAMNSFFCSTKRPFLFVGRMNEDVNTYTSFATRGRLFLSTNQVSLNQKQTQTNAGGMTEFYQKLGTYRKSFYTVMYCPSAVKIDFIHGAKMRIHHRINWKHVAPKIMRQSVKK